MSVHWGFYCKECDVESRRWFKDPRHLRSIFEKAGLTFQDVWTDQPLRLPTAEIEPLFFLARHFRHDLWIQCELAQIKLAQLDGDPLDGENDPARQDSSAGLQVSL